MANQITEGAFYPRAKFDFDTNMMGEEMVFVDAESRDLADISRTGQRPVVVEMIRSRSAPGASGTARVVMASGREHTSEWQNLANFLVWTRSVWPGHVSTKWSD